MYSQVLKGVSLSVKRGQSAALVGHSGCGKSTIIQLISRYYDVIEGSVSMCGKYEWINHVKPLCGHDNFPVSSSSSMQHCKTLWFRREAWCQITPAMLTGLRGVMRGKQAHTCKGFLFSLAETHASWFFMIDFLCCLSETARPNYDSR